MVSGTGLGWVGAPAWVRFGGGRRFGWRAGLGWVGAPAWVRFGGGRRFGWRAGLGSSESPGPTLEMHASTGTFIGSGAAQRHDSSVGAPAWVVSRVYASTS